MMFKDYLNVNAHFQNSINLGLDLNDSDKVNSYIPTSTGINFLNHFIDNVQKVDGDNSSMVIAPYGKGKSHAILVLLSLLMDSDYRKFKILLDKIKVIDIELYDKIRKLKTRKFLPVIISNTRGTLNQSLFKALQKALDSSGINNIVLDTDFYEVECRLNDWKKNYEKTYSIFVKTLNNRKISLSDFNKGITAYDEYYLNIFKDIHKEILSGAEFVSQNSMEVVDYYQNVANQLVESHGYDGIYIVFDEFSKFLESRDQSTVANDMKIIQDLAELCNSTHNMYFQLILHKPINDYLSIDKRIRNSFKGIEGRVSSYYFVSSLKNSFDLVSSVLNKKSTYQKIKEENVDLHKQVVNDLLDLPTFNVEFEKDYLLKSLVDDCYPLHPITVQMLIKINEKVAQNERTLFTFLAKKSSNSLLTLIEKETDEKLLMPYVVFDYFENLLLEEKDNINIQKITSQSLSAIKNVNDEKQIQLIKTLALILINNEKDSMPSNTSVLAKSMMISHDECKQIVSELVNKGLLVQRHSGQIEFKINMDMNIDIYIDDIIVKKYSRLNIDKELANVADNKYYYPRTYNISNSITRYLQVEYILEEDFLKLKTVDYYFDNNYIDGLILNIIRKDDNISENILCHVKEIDNDRLVVVYPKSAYDYKSILQRLLAIKSLLNDKEFIDNNVLIKTELELMYDDMFALIGEKLQHDYSLDSKYNYLFNTFNNSELNENKGTLSKDRILGNILSNSFNRYPENLNLELLNKNNVKGTYKQAREKVIEKMLNNTLDCTSLGTSPEDTIINCLLVETGIISGKVNDKIKDIINEIEVFFENENECFGDVYDVLRKPPFGLRKGIIPLLITNTIKTKKQYLILKYKGQEIELSAKNIEAINDEPSAYTFMIDEINSSKIEYINQLANMFACTLSDDMSKNYLIVTQAIKDWYAGLPKYTKQMMGKHLELSASVFKKLRKQLNQSNINSSEFILFVLPKIVGTNDLESVLKHVSEMKLKLDSFISYYLTWLKEEVNEVLGFDKKTNIIQSINYWVDSNKIDLESVVLEEYVKDFLKAVRNASHDSELMFINRIAFTFTELFVEDWSEKTHELFEMQLRKVKSLENKKNNEDSASNQLIIRFGDNTITKSFDDELDDSTELLEGFIESTMEDYGDLLTNEQKIALLIKIMKKYF